MEKGLNFVDLFSGCGGFSCGFEKAGHTCVLGVDHNQDAINTFALNHKKAKTYCGDITKLSESALKKLINIKKVDMVIGGPPCQGFSTVGRGESSDPRNSLFLQFVKIVKWTKPKIIVLENVTGLLATKNEKTLKKIYRSFEKLGFSLEARVLSSEQFGVPEKRRRTIIIGVQKGLGKPSFPEKTHGIGTRKKLVTVDRALSQIYKRVRNFNHDVETAKLKNKLDNQRLKHLPPGAGIRYERDEKKHLPKRLRYDVNWDELREKRFRQAKLQRLNPDQPSYTILTSRTMYIHPHENRYLTAREAATLQSFPLGFKFTGSLTSQFRQIGNAVPVGLAYHLGMSVYKILKNKNKKITKTSAKDLAKIREFAFNYRQSASA